MIQRFVVARQYIKQLCKSVGAFYARKDFFRQGEQWHNLRSKLTPHITSPRTVRAILPTLNAICDDFVEMLKLKRSSDCVVENFQDYANLMGLEGSSASFTLFHTIRWHYLSISQLFARWCSGDVWVSCPPIRQKKLAFWLPQSRKYLPCNEIHITVLAYGNIFRPKRTAILCTARRLFISM